MAQIKNNSKTAQLVSLVIISLVVSFLVFFFEIFLNKPSFGTENKKPIIYLSKNPNLLIWLFMGIIQITFCIILSPVLLNQIKDLNQKFGLRKKDFFVTLLLLIFFVMATLLSTILLGHTDILRFLEEKHLINHATFKLNFIIFIGYLIASSCIYILLIVNKIINTLKEPSYFEYIFLKKKIELTLNILGFIITASTIATALLQTIVEKEDIFPKQMVYAYGLFNTLFIALIFIPVSFELTSGGEVIVEKKLTGDKLKIDNPEDFLKKKKTYEELYEIKEDYLNILKKAVPILAPLLASLLNYTGLK